MAFGDGEAFFNSFFYIKKYIYLHPKSKEALWFGNQ